MQRQVAQWFTKKDELKLQCHLCPRQCIINDTQKAFCGVRSNHAGTLYSDAWGKLAAINLDPIEKKPLYHFYPAQSVLSLGTLGCNLRCQFCQNWTLSCANYDNPTQTTSPQQIIDLCTQHSCHMLAYTYNEPLVWAEYAIECAKIAKPKGIKSIMVSAGYVQSTPREEIFAHMDAANIDLKGFSEEFYKNFTSAQLGPVLETIKYLHTLKDFWLEITTLLIPGLNDSPEMLRAEFEWICKELGPYVPLHLSGFHPDHKMREIHATPLKTLLFAQNLALEIGLQYVYLGNVMHETHTQCPQCANLLIKRKGYDVQITGLKDNCCTKCMRPLEGHFAQAPAL